MPPTEPRGALAVHELAATHGQARRHEDGRAGARGVALAAGRSLAIAGWLSQVAADLKLVRHVHLTGSSMTGPVGARNGSREIKITVDATNETR